jgi:DNA helicase-2/ATP-dependent DNA helicase PcrA
MEQTYLTQLNPAQQKAALWPKGSVLVLAGAGSGKTKVLTSRIAWLMREQGIKASAIMAVTFTNKAAKEMNLRLTAMLSVQNKGMWMGTFHGLCHRLLRAHASEAGLPKEFQILDIQDQQSLVKRLQKSLQINDERYPAKQMVNLFNKLKEEGLRSSAALGLGATEQALYKAYEQQCQKDGVVDFAELLLRSVDLLNQQPLLREHYQNRFEHILVDEFQDTNPLQYAWLKLLSGSQTHVLAVGDDDQSIYGFRGALVRHMQDFQRDFSVLEVIKLEQNYRSHGHILAAANALIKCNKERIGKELWTEAGVGEPIRVFEAENDFAECQFIVDEIRLLHQTGIDYQQIAILYRSNAQSRLLEQGLFRFGIPYRVYGGLRFFERQEIKHALAYLRLVANGDDDGAFLRIVNFPTRGIGARSIEQIQNQAQIHGVSLMQAARLAVQEQKSSGVLVQFVHLIDQLRLCSEQQTLTDLIKSCVELSGLLSHYQKERDGADRLENLIELENAASQFTDENESHELTDFLAHACLESGGQETLVGSDALQLMTVHSAKGLEFSVVFVCGMEDGLFPHENAMSEAKGLEEERRLAYVAITRARERLYFTRADQRMLHGQTRYGIRSRFLDEIPDQLFLWLSTRGFSRQPKMGGNTSSAGKPSSFPKNTTESRRDQHAFRLGQTVHHPRFGSGIVLDLEGTGQDGRVQVKFFDHGIKWLVLSLAKLTT